jgi:large subunit ribosomal protein L15
MKLNDLKPAAGSKKARRRVGRGLGSGRGKTAGRGQKGQSSRSGFSQGAGWEGGRSRLIMRLPKRGFNHEKEHFQLVNLEDLNVFEAGARVDADSLRQRGLIRHADRPVKLLGRGELGVAKLDVDVDAFSRSAAAAVQANGGTVRGAEAELSAAAPEARRVAEDAEEGAEAAGGEKPAAKATSKKEPAKKSAKQPAKKAAAKAESQDETKPARKPATKKAAAKDEGPKDEKKAAAKPRASKGEGEAAEGRDGEATESGTEEQS